MSVKFALFLISYVLAFAAPWKSSIAQPDYSKTEQMAAFCKGGSEVMADFYARLAAFESMSFEARAPYRQARDDRYADIERYNKFLSGRTDIADAYIAGRKQTQSCLNDQVGANSCSMKCQRDGGTTEQCAERCPLPPSCTAKPSCIGFKLP